MKAVLRLSTLQILIVSMACGFLLLFAHAVRAQKVSAAYDGGRLIDNGAFLDSNSMNASQIQSFLASKGAGIASMNFVLNCYGQDSLERQWYTAVGAPCDQSIPASHIIYYASQIYGVSPKVVLATLQKEQSLVTAANPTSWQINQAMGYGCPTSGGCGASTFFYQIDSGVWVLRYHYERARGNMNWWKPSSGWTCGTAKAYYRPSLHPGQNVDFIDQDGIHYRTHFIANAATSSLYCYTPHAYNNPQGSYGLPTYGHTGRYYTGSYNFVRFYEAWFDPSSTIINNVAMRIVSQPTLSPARGQTVSYTVSFKNNHSASIVVNAIGVVGRAGSLNGANRDFGWQGQVTLQPGITQEYTFTTTVRDIGSLYAWPAINYQGTYVHYNNWGVHMSARTPKLSLTSPLSSSVPNPVAGQNVTLSTIVKNNESVPINTSALGIPVRFYDKYNYDAVWVNPPGGMLQPNASQLLSGTITFDKPGPYKAWVSGLIADQYTALSSNLNFNVTQPTPNFSLTYLEKPNLSPAVGEDVVVKFKLKNNSGVSMTLGAVGVVGRYDNPYTGTNNDFGWQGQVTFTPGEEKSFTTFIHNIKDTRTLYAWVAFTYQGKYIHYNNWGFALFPRIPNLTNAGHITLNNGSPFQAGQAVTVVSSITNNESKPIKYSALGIPIRFYGKYNYDATWIGPDIIQPGETVQLSSIVKFDKPGPYTIWNSILINGRYITIGNVRSITL